MAEITLEIAAYERMQSDLEREHMGKWVVVHDEQLIGAYEDGTPRKRPSSGLGEDRSYFGSAQSL